MRVSRLLLLAQRKREAIRMPTGTAFLLPVFLRVLIKVHLSAALRGTSKPQKYTVGRNQNPGRYEPSPQIYADKIATEKDQEKQQQQQQQKQQTTSATIGGEGGSQDDLASFAYEWHVHRYGLRQLAETNCLDLIAAV